MPRQRRPISDLQAKIALQIVDYIRENDLEPGRHLAEDRFATLFGVSRTPIRRTLEHLAERGVVEIIPNRGFFLAKPAAEIDPATLGIPVSEEETLYSNIVRDKIRGELGDEVTEIDLIRRYGLQRGPVSRVLWRLSKEGVIDRSAGMGWTFQPMINSPDAVAESYRIRLLIEPAGLLEPSYELDAARLAKSRDQHLEMLERGPHTVSAADFFEANALFHETLAHFSRNRFFIQVVQQQNRLRRFMEYKAQQIPRLKESCLEHLDICKALEEGDREWAAQLLQRHLSLASKLHEDSYLSESYRAQGRETSEPVN